MEWLVKKIKNAPSLLSVNTLFLVAILFVLGYVVYNTAQPPVKYSAGSYDATPAVICAGDSVSWSSHVEMRAARQPADMTTARDLWDETNNRRVPGIYRAHSFIIPHSVAYTETQVFSNTVGLQPADYIISDTTGGRLTARDGYTVRFTVKACGGT